MEDKINSNINGMFLDRYSPGEGGVSFALNANIQSTDGSRFAYTNELGNQLCTKFKPGFQVVGQPYYIIEKDIILFALYNPDTGESEIGKVTSFNKDCLTRVSHEEDCGCFKGSNLEDEVVESLSEQEIPCQPTDVCTCYIIEGVSPDDTSAFEVYYTDCNGEVQDKGDSLSTFFAGSVFCVKNHDLRYLDPRAKLTKLNETSTPCDPIKILSCCTYETILNQNCLNFSPDYPVYFRHKQTNCDTLIYFVSRNNPPRKISLSLPKGVDECGKPKTFISCDELDLFPKTCHPEIITRLINGGGSLKAGSNRFTLAYTDRYGNELTDYFDLTSETPVFERTLTVDTDYVTSKSIEIELKHYTDIFDFFNLVVEETINGVSAYYLIGTYRVNDIDRFTYTGTYKEEYSSTRVLNRTPRYETAGIIEDSDDILFLADLESDVELNLQPLCNQIPLYWETVKMPANNKDFNYSNGVIVSHFRGYMRDEVYGFGVKFKLKTGKYTRVFHIPGRASKPSDLALVPKSVLGTPNNDVFDGTTNCEPIEDLPTWKVYNTASSFAQNKFECTPTDDTKEKLFSCEIFKGVQGEFAYWESALTYPCNEDIWGDLAGRPVRLHKFPDCAITHIHNDYPNPNNTRQETYPIGVRPDLNVLDQLVNEFAIYNPKTKKKDLYLKDFICGFELVRTSRVGNKSVIAKGLVYDVGMAEDKENSRSYYFPNYPYNDTRDKFDPFLSTSSEVYNTSDVGLKFADLKQYNSPKTKLRYTFHSPDTHFQYPQIGTELKLESCEYGKWSGHFVQVAHHPRYRFLTKYDFALSAALGSLLSIELSNSAETVVTLPAASGAINVGETRFNLAQILSNTELFKDLLEKSLPHINYAWQYNSKAEYTQAKFPTKGNIRRRIDVGQYLSPLNQTVGDDLPVWNYQRESSVYIKINNKFSKVAGVPDDDSRNSLSSHNSGWCDEPTNFREGNVAANYVSIKRTIEDQYGPINNFNYVNTGDFYKMETSSSGQGHFVCKYYPTFGGDIFINRFTLKRKMPFFTQNMVGRPDGVNFDYWLTPNVMYPTYYIGTSPDAVSFNDVFTTTVKTELIAGLAGLLVGAVSPEGLTQKIANLVGYTGVGLGTATALTNLLSAFVPKNNLDCDTTAFASGLNFSNLKDFVESVFSKNSNLNPFQQEGKFYLAAYGLPTFFVESEVNVDMRHGRNPDEENFYPNVGDNYDDWLQEYRVPIKFDNYYSYNSTYSKQNFENFNEPYNDFVPDEICESYFPNRVIYSDESNREEKRDSWSIFRANNYFDFPKTNGRLIALNSVENNKMLARFENTTQAYNSRIIIDSSYPTQLELGTGNMFAQKPVDYVKADLGYVGSQHKAYVSCKHGSFWTDAKRGFVYQLSGSSGFDEITKDNFNWFKRNLPFQILEDFPNYNIDNSFKDIGIAMVWDERFERLFITKKDYKVVEKYKGKISVVNGKFRYTDLDVSGDVDLDNPEYFENKSFTISYSPLTKQWVSFHSFLPNYYVGLTTHFQSGTKEGLWNHLISPLRYQTYYNKFYPYIIEYSIDTLPNVCTINSVTLIQDIQKFYNKTDYYSLGSSNYVNDINFTKAIVYNKEQCSGLLSLVPENPKDKSQRIRYPKVNNDRIEVLYSHRENKFTFNGFWNSVNSTVNNQNIMSTDWSLLKNDYFIDKTLNPKALAYTVRKGYQTPIKSTHCRVRLIQDKHDRYRFTNLLQITKINPSII